MDISNPLTYGDLLNLCRSICADFPQDIVDIIYKHTGFGLIHLENQNRAIKRQLYNLHFQYLLTYLEYHPIRVKLSNSHIITADGKCWIFHVEFTIGQIDCMDSIQFLVDIQTHETVALEHFLRQKIPLTEIIGKFYYFMGVDLDDDDIQSEILSEALCNLHGLYLTLDQFQSMMAVVNQSVAKYFQKK